MPQYRVGKDGLRVTTPRGTYSLPPGAVVDELPEHYEGTLEVIEWKRLDGYEDKMLRPAEDKLATKPTPARRPDPRLSNCVLEGGRSKSYPPAEDK